MVISLSAARKMDEHAPDIIETNEDDFAQRAAVFLWDTIKDKDRPLLALPTGNTPRDIYKTLIENYAGNKDIWHGARYLALDEYAGLPAGDKRLFANWLGRTFLDDIGIPENSRTVFDSMATDEQAEAERIETWIAQNGPIDVAVLGLGTNGHIAFNEPGSAFESVTRCVTLSPKTREANAAYWGDITQVPERAFTLGLKTIAAAKQIILLVSGAHKAEILDKVLNGPVTEDIPATILRTAPHVTIVADKAALGVQSGVEKEV